MQEQASQLRLDRRLTRRRGFAGSDQLEKELRALPDVSDKGELVDSPQFKAPANEAAAPAEGE